jgi:hypothetical protein
MKTVVVQLTVSSTEDATSIRERAERIVARYSNEHGKVALADLAALRKELQAAGLDVDAAETHAVH